MAFKYSNHPSPQVTIRAVVDIKSGVAETNVCGQTGHSVGDNGLHQAMTKQRIKDCQQVTFNFKSHVDKRDE